MSEPSSIPDSLSWMNAIADFFHDVGGKVGLFVVGGSAFAGAVAVTKFNKKFGQYATVARVDELEAYRIHWERKWDEKVEVALKGLGETIQHNSSMAVAEIRDVKRSIDARFLKIDDGMTDVKIGQAQAWDSLDAMKGTVDEIKAQCSRGECPPPGKVA